MMDMNPMVFLNLIKSKNPQEMVMTLVQNNKINNPIIADLIKYAQAGDDESVNKIAEDFFRQNGMDFNKEMASFMSMMK